MSVKKSFSTSFVLLHYYYFFISNFILLIPHCIVLQGMMTEDAVDGLRGVVINTASVAAFDGQIGQVCNCDGMTS